MSMEKRNVVEEKRTPAHEKGRDDDDWDKQGADLFTTIKDEVAELGGISVLDSVKDDANKPEGA